MNQSHDPPPEKSKRAAEIAMKAIVAAARPFDHRGLTANIVRALVAVGIDYPERLLFMSKTELQNIPGIGKASLAKIELYRARFLPKQGAIFCTSIMRAIRVSRMKACAIAK